MFAAHLLKRGLLAVSGADRLSFLQGLLTNDVRKLSSGGGLYTLMLSPQGKYLHDGFLVAQGERILIDTDRARVSELAKRLALYKLRAKVEIAALAESYGVVALWGEDAMPPAPSDIIRLRDPRLPALGFRAIGEEAAMNHWLKNIGANIVSEAEYESHRLKYGVPDGAQDMTPEKSFPLEWWLDQLQAVDYAKGCYVGQEVTARVHYRGQVRKMPYIVESKDSALPPIGTAVTDGHAAVGELRSSQGALGLALLRSEDVKRVYASGGSLQAEGIALTIRKPSWIPS